MQFAFGDYVLDVERRELHRDGQVQAVACRLLALAQAWSRVLWEANGTRHWSQPAGRLLDKIWREPR
jgi:hypothetical protein